MEEDVQRNIKHKSKSQVSLNVAALRASIIGNQDVVFYWSIAAPSLMKRKQSCCLKKSQICGLLLEDLHTRADGWSNISKKKKKEYKRANHFILECSVVQKTHDYVIC